MNKTWQGIEEELEKKVLMVLYGLPEWWDEETKKFISIDAQYNNLGVRAKKIVSLFKPYFQEKLHGEAKEELEKECWCGDAFGKCKVLKQKSESSWEQEFDKIIGTLPEHKIFETIMGSTCFMCGHPTNPNEAIEKIKDFISKVEKEAYERGWKSVDNSSTK